MNYFAHAIKFIGQPYFVAGTAIPDWLNVVNRKSRARAKYAEPLAEHENPRVAAIAQGILQHHFDDAWFHQTRAFNELSLDFSVKIRDLLKYDEGFRPSFLGHILVELLLDSHLIDERPARLRDYYTNLRSLDVQLVQATVNRIVKIPVSLLDYFIGRFCEDQFLFDYLSDERLMYRLNRVMQRVRLSALPDSLLEFLPYARQQVKARMPELLTRPLAYASLASL